MQGDFEESNHCELFAGQKSSWKSISWTLCKAPGRSCDPGDTGKQSCGGGVQLLHFWGAQSVTHADSSAGTAPGDMLHPGRGDSEQSLAGAVNAPLSGPSGSPELCELFGHG